MRRDGGGAGEHDHDADAGERGEGVQRVGRDPAEDRDDEVDAPVRPQVLEHRRQPVALVGTDRGERVDHVVPRVAAGAEHLARRW